MALLNFSKEFDTISHSMLITQFQYFGLSYSFVKCFEQYLICAIFSDVVQKSVLGTLQVYIYGADMFIRIKHSKIQQYADELQVYTAFSFNNMVVIIAKFNINLKNSKEFSDNHNVKFIPSTSVLCFFGNRSTSERVKQTFGP